MFPCQRPLYLLYHYTIVSYNLSIALPTSRLGQNCFFRILYRPRPKISNLTFIATLVIKKLSTNNQEIFYELYKHVIALLDTLKVELAKFWFLSLSW